VVTDRVRFGQAARACRTSGAQLATPRTYAENAALAKVAGGDVYLSLDPRA
jgi:hypothetical protein